MRKIEVGIARKIAMAVVCRREDVKRKKQAEQKRKEGEERKEGEREIIKEFKKEKEYLEKIYRGIKDEASRGRMCFLFRFPSFEDKYEMATGRTKIEAEYLAKKLRKDKFEVVLQEDIRGDDNKYFMHYSGSRRVLKISW